MKMIKKIAPICLAAVMGATYVVPALASPEFARTEEEWAKLRDNVMEYDELEALIHEYNVTVLNNKENLNSDRGKTKEEMSQALRDAANEIYSGITYPSDDTLPTYAGQYAAAVSAEQTAKSLDSQADNNVEDGEIRKLQYDQIEASMASGAQSSMNNLMQLIESRKTLEANYEMLNAVYNATVIQQGEGMVTQADVWTAQQQVQNMEASLANVDANIKKMRQSLCVMTGWTYDANPEIMALPAVDVSRIDTMNPTEDLVKARENNYTLKIDKRKLANASGGSTEKTLKKTVDEEEQKLGAAFNNQYQAVLQAKTAYDQAKTDYELAVNTMDTAQRKFDLKMLSQLEYLQAKAAFVEKQVTLTSADMKLLQAIETYDWAVRGLLSLS